MGLGCLAALRAREIQPGFFKNAVLGHMPYMCRLLFAGLWLMADRAGRLEDSLPNIKADIFPFDDVDIDGALSALAEKGFITRYQAFEVRVIQVNTFDRHQHPHPHETLSIYPPPPLGATLLTPVEAAPQGEKVDKVGKAERAEKVGRGQRSAVPDPFVRTQRLLDWAAQKVPGINLERETEKFVAHYQATGGRMLDWNAAWRKWMIKAVEFEEENNARRNKIAPGAGNTTLNGHGLTRSGEQLVRALVGNAALSSGGPKSDFTPHGAPGKRDD